MISFLIRRFISSLIVLWVIVTASFFVMKAAPGGPFDRDRALPDEVKANIERRYDLDKPLFEQYLIQLKRIAVDWDFGPSMKYPDKTVNQILWDGLPVSFTLGLMGLFFAVAIGLPAGLWAAMRRNAWGDYAAMTAAMAGVSIPNFVLGPLLIYFFALRVPLFSTGGWLEEGMGFVDFLRITILPSLTLGLYYAAYIARLSRGGMLEIIHQDFMRTARAKGLSEKVIVVRHALKGAILPVVSYLGPAFAGMLTGSVVVEKVFNIPGLGTHFVTSAFNRDYPLVLGTIVLYSAFLVVLNLIVDLLYSLLDPRVAHA